MQCAMHGGGFQPSIVPQTQHNVLILKEPAKVDPLKFAQKQPQLVLKDHETTHTTKEKVLDSSWCIDVQQRLHV